MCVVWHVCTNTNVNVQGKVAPPLAPTCNEHIRSEVHIIELYPYIMCTPIFKKLRS